jgi:hypothetical protein
MPNATAKSKSTKSAKTSTETTATEQKAEETPVTLKTSEVAEAIGTTQRTFRIFLREQKMGVGNGNRYSFTKTDVEKLAPKFKQWESDKAAERERKRKERESRLGSSEDAMMNDAKAKEAEAQSSTPADDNVTEEAA